MVDTPRTRAFMLASEFQDGQTATLSPQYVRDLLVTLLGPPVTLSPSAGAVTWPLATAPIATVTITANTTITVTGGEDGMVGYRLAIIQGGAGNFTPTFSGVTLSTASPTWNTTAGSSNRVYIDVVGATLMADVV